MANISVNVDIDLDEFDLEEILKHLKHVYGTNKFRERISINDFVKELATGLPVKETSSSMIDNWKDELWPLIKDKYTLEQLEAFLNG